MEWVWTGWRFEMLKMFSVMLDFTWVYRVWHGSGYSVLLQDTVFGRTHWIAQHLHCAVSWPFIFSLFFFPKKAEARWAVSAKNTPRKPCFLRSVMSFNLSNRLKFWFLGCAQWTLAKDQQLCPAGILYQLYAVFDPHISPNEAWRFSREIKRRDPRSSLPELVAIGCRFDVHVTSGGLGLTHSMDFFTNLAFKAIFWRIKGTATTSVVPGLLGSAFCGRDAGSDGLDHYQELHHNSKHLKTPVLGRVWHFSSAP